MTNEKLEALKNLVMFLAEKATTSSIEEFEFVTNLMDEVRNAFPEQPSDLL